MLRKRPTAPVGSRWMAPGAPSGHAELSSRSAVGAEQARADCVHMPLRTGLPFAHVEPQLDEQRGEDVGAAPRQPGHVLDQMVPTGAGGRSGPVAGLGDGLRRAGGRHRAAQARQPIGRAAVDPGLEAVGRLAGPDGESDAFHSNRLQHVGAADAVHRRGEPGKRLYALPWAGPPGRIAAVRASRRSCSPSSSARAAGLSPR